MCLIAGHHALTMQRSHHSWEPRARSATLTRLQGHSPDAQDGQQELRASYFVKADKETDSERKSVHRGGSGAENHLLWLSSFLVSPSSCISQTLPECSRYQILVREQVVEECRPLTNNHVKDRDNPRW